MKKNLFGTKKAQFMVENSMSNITRATRKVLKDYISRMYYLSLAKAIAYLEVNDFEAETLLDYLEPEARTKVIKYAKKLQKHEECVISEVEHIIATSGINLDDDYQIIKKNLLNTDQHFVELSLDKFRKETPLFQKQLNECIFAFEDLSMLEDRAIQKILHKTGVIDLSKALKGTSKKLQDKFFCNMSKQAETMLKEYMEFMEPVNEADVKAAQTRIIQYIFYLEKMGEIVITHYSVGKLITSLHNNIT